MRDTPDVPFFINCRPSRCSRPKGSSLSTATMKSALLLSFISLLSFVHSQSSTTPTSTANVSPAWQTAYAKAQNAVANLTLADKVSLGTGTGLLHGPCVGNTKAISKIDFPGFCLQDSPLGVRYADLVSAFPAAINVAATFNRDLMYQRGVAIGSEHRGKGVTVALGPMMNIMRAPAAGRNWEGFGGDPYLSGEGAFQTIQGTQSVGIQACAKHFINNEQEHSRESSSSNVDDKTQHEIYLIPFIRSVQAGVASFMCSYNQVNGTFSCSNDKVINGLLKGETGFPGYVMSDWLATHATSDVNAGLDMTMPGDIIPVIGGDIISYFGPALEIAVALGDVTEARMDDLATRVLAAWYLLGQDSADYPEVNFNSWLSFLGQHVNVQGDHASLIRQIGSASTVLLKNTRNVLPLKAPKTIAVIGSGGGPSSKGNPNGYSDRGGNDGVLAMGWGSGTCDFPYLTTPLDAITSRSSVDGTVVSSSLSDSDLDKAKSTAAGKDVAFVFITSDSGEAYITVEGNAGDRNDLFAWHGGDALVEAVASVNNNTIVVVNTVGPVITEAWVENVNVTGVVWAGLPGQEAGNSLVDVLYGDVNPSGRLPYTIAKNSSDYSASVIYESTNNLQIPYTEGIFVDYRHFDKAGIEPRYEFGFGLSYTTFEYSDLQISGSTTGGTRQPNGPGQNLDPWLHEQVVTVTFTVKNNGSVAGTEIPQLYTTPPASANSSPMNLKGFDSISLAAGESQAVTMQLSRFDLSFWNVINQRYELHTGETGISIGASSRDIRLTGSLTV